VHPLFILNRAKGIMRLVRIIVGWLLAPRQLLSLAALCSAGGLLWGYATLQENADRTLALRQGPPTAVAVESYRGAVHRGPAGEVVLHAVGQPEAPIILTMPGSGERALVVPLFPLSGEEGAQGAIFLPLDGLEAMPDPRALATPLGDGIVMVNGRVVDSGDFGLVLAGALAVQGRHVGERFVAVRPYLDGREAALQPVANPPRTWLWPLGLALLLALAASYRQFGGGLRLGFRRPAAPAPRPAAAPVVSAHFPPLPRQEEVNDRGSEPGRSVWAAIMAGAGIAMTAARILLRLTAGLLRLVWAGVEEIRSPR
jgi:hypothetical protein